MLKKSWFKLLGLVFMVSILFIAQAQAEQPGWKKTITLQSGEVVCDLNGEWDFLWMGRHEYQTYRFRDVLKITQQDNSFEGIRMKGYQANPKGSKAIEGELNKDGFEKLIYVGGLGTFNAPKGKISKDGNTIEIEDTLFVIELTRK